VFKIFLLPLLSLALLFGAFLIYIFFLNRLSEWIFERKMANQGKSVTWDLLCTRVRKESGILVHTKGNNPGEWWWLPNFDIEDELSYADLVEKGFLVTPPIFPYTLKKMRKCFPNAPIGTLFSSSFGDK